MLQILIRRDEDLKPLLGLAQQVAVLKIRPPQFERRGDFVGRESVTQRGWRTLIKENTHAAAGSGHLNRQRRLGELEDRQSLLARHAGKPFEELVHRRAAFEILEERLHRHACSLEHPGSAYLPGHAFHRRTHCPIQHALQTTLPPGHGQAGSSLQVIRLCCPEKTKLLESPRPFGWERVTEGRVRVRILTSRESSSCGAEAKEETESPVGAKDNRPKAANNVSAAPGKRPTK